MATKRKQADRKQITKSIKQAAETYKAQLVGKTFLYVFDNRYIEVIFKAENFKHLTGVDSPLQAKRFYRLAVRKELMENQIYFSSRHPFSLCQKKLKHIEELAEFASTESFMLEEITTSSYQYKFGTTDLNFTLCMGEDLDTEGNKKSNCYVVQSLRDEDCFDKSKDAYVITHILTKPNDEKLYKDILFIDSSSSECALPDSIKSLVCEEVLRQLK